MRKLYAVLGAFVMLVAFAACNSGTIGPVDPVVGTPVPIVLVHGWNSSPSAWDTFTQRLEADGFPAGRIANFDYDDTQSNVITAGQLGTFIDQTLASTGAHQVDVVTHSMGSLAIRYLLKNNTSYWPKVKAVAAISGPNHGTDLADLWFGDSTVEMRPGSDFLNALDTGDETPGPAAWGVWYSHCDEVIIPNTSSVLDGALVNDDAGCIEHSDMHDDAGVYLSIRQFLDAHG